MQWFVSMLLAQAQDGVADVAATASDAASKAPAGAPGGGINLIFMVFMVLIAMYFLFVLPKKSQAKQTQKMLNGLTKNDKVMTTSGIIGLVYSVDQESGEVVLKVDEANNTKIRFSAQAIYYVFKKDEGGKAADTAKESSEAEKSDK